ncbi:hypothetical protein ACFE04_002069 [Oxalis oulophora]
MTTEVRRGGVPTWHDDLTTLIDTGIKVTSPKFVSEEVMMTSAAEEESESVGDQIRGFLKSWGEMLVELGRGCIAIVQQSDMLTDDSFIVQNLGKPLSKASKRLSFFNHYLPEDRDPMLAWPIVFSVFLVALLVLNVNSKCDSMVPLVKKVRMHPPSATRIQLPDGRYMAYQDIGVPADRARISLIAPHSFLSSRLSGIPGIKMSLLEEYGVRLITYDLPGFGESDPHPRRNLNTSAMDMLYLADTLGVNEKFWVLGYSAASLHTWSTLKYIPDRIAGAALFAPLINPYEPSMTRDEMSRTWEQWLPKRKLMYFLARRLPKLLSFFYRRRFLSGNHGQVDNWLSLSLGEKDVTLIGDTRFEEFWQRDVEESIRQGSVKPFIEEAALQVSNWGSILEDVRVQKKCPGKGILPWLKSFYSQAECELAGFLGPIHIWQGMDDTVVPPSITEYISRILPTADIHRLQNEGHFSYFFFCDECHRQIFSTLFGSPQGPLDLVSIPAQNISGEEAQQSDAPRVHGIPTRDK